MVTARLHEYVSAVRGRIGVHCGVLCTLLSVLAAGEARAQESCAPVEKAKLALRATVGYFTASRPNTTENVVTLRAHGQYKLESWVLAGDLGLVLLESSPEVGSSDLALRAGNPALYGLYQDRLWEGTYRIGFGVAGPLATLDDNGNARLQRVAFNLAAGMTALWEQWLWAIDRGALLGFAEIEERLVDKTWVKLELTPALMLPARGAFGNESADVLLPLALSLGARHRVVWFGARTQAVYMPTAAPDSMQLAIGPWIRIATEPVFAEVLALGAVDEPLAGTRGAGAWGIHLSAGAGP